MDSDPDLMSMITFRSLYLTRKDPMAKFDSLKIVKAFFKD